MVRFFTNGCRLAAGRKPAPQVRSFLLGLAALAALALSAPAATFTASLDRATVTFGETATLSLTFAGAEPATVPAPPAIPNLQISYLGPSRQFSIGNGQMSSTVTHNFTVAARQPGDYVIPALRVEVGGQFLTSQPLAFQVLRPDPRDQLAFLRLHVPKREVYAGEILTVEVQICLRDLVQNIGNVQLSPLKADGFSVLKNARLPDRREQISNGVFTVISMAYALVAAKTGTLTLGPVDCNLVAELPSSQARRRDPFGGLGFGFFRTTEQKQVAVSAEAQTVQAIPLPVENVPPGFTGAVGHYTLSFSAGPTNVAVGDPVTVRVLISGRGALDALALAEQTAWKEFKTYPPTANVQTSDPLGVQGTKAFEQVVVPQSTDIKELPGLAFSYFDPDAKAYRTLTQPAVKLTVRPGGATPAPVIAAGKPAAEDAPPPAQDIVGIKQRLGIVVMTQSPLALRPAFWALNAAPLLAWLAAVVWRKRADSLARNPRLRRKRQVAQLVNEGLEELRQLAAENKSESFFATLFRLLQEQIGERLDLPASAITEAVVDERLQAAGLPDSACASLHELFKACNLARYAPVQTSQELAAFVPRLQALVLQLRRLEE